MPPMSQTDKVYNVDLTDTFFVLQFVGLLGIMAILCAMLSRNVRRFSTRTNFLASMGLSCISYCILPAAHLHSKPSYEFCLVQSALVYASPPMIAMAGLSFVIHIWVDLKAIVPSAGLKYHRKRTMLLLVFPYIIYILVTVVALIVGLRNRGSVQLDVTGMYCTNETGILGKIASVLSIIGLLGIISFEGMILAILRRRRRDVSHIKNDDTPPLSIIGRVLTFTAFCFLSISCSSYFLVWRPSVTDYQSYWPNIILSFIPLAAVIIFGSQREILRSWLLDIAKIRLSFVNHFVNL